MKNLLVSCLIFLSASAFSQTIYSPEWNSLDARPLPGWFGDAKFGIFIHWGVFSVPSWGPLPKDGAGIYDCYAEWYWKRLVDTSEKMYPLFNRFHQHNYGKEVKYPDFVKDFKAQLFQPDDWAAILKSSGAKYVVLTSKHHEGFTLWPSAQSWNWNAVDVGPHRDLAGDLIRSVKAAGLKMGFYYSLYEWFNPLYKQDVGKYVDEHMTPQIKDLVNRYKPDVLWGDGEWEHPSSTWKTPQLLAWLYNESPVKDSVVVNDRWGSDTRGKHGGYYTTEYDLIGDENASAKTIEHAWEECRGIGHSFGYNRNENLEDYASAQDLIFLLISKVSRGGNLLLNIGPTADGRIPVIMQQRLREMGEWLKINGEAIYGTRVWLEAPPVPKESNIFFTRKGKDVYVFTPTVNNKNLVIPGILKGAKISLLGSAKSLQSAYSGGALSITPPTILPDQTISPFAWVYKIEGAL